MPRHGDKSSDLPCGTPSMMSTSATSAKPLSASKCAVVAPTLPAPTTVIFFLAILHLLFRFYGFKFQVDRMAHIACDEDHPLELNTCLAQRHGGDKGNYS